MALLFYRRPDYLQKSSGPINATECAVYVQRAKKSERAIPKGLSFDEIIDNKALPPCSLPDFMDYLTYIEMNAENLQFYLWYKDYVRRWESEVSKGDQALSPAWDFAAREVLEAAKEPNVVDSRAGRVLRKSSKTKMSRELTPSVNLNGMTFFDGDSPVTKPSRAVIPEGASVMSFGSSQSPKAPNGGQTWQAFSIQPGREEVNQIILHYLSFDSPRELNLSSKDRLATLHALQHTTHPSALLKAFEVVEVALRGQSHPNFIRWSICNGNKPRVFFVRTMGIAHTGFGFIIAIVLTLSNVSRWWRILAFLMWFVGISTLIAAYKGLCVILHASHMRALRPWEDDTSSINSSESDLEKAKKHNILMPSRVQVSEQKHDGTVRQVSTFVAGHKRDSSDTERWEEAYQKKTVVQKVFDKQVWTQDETLRLLQDKIVLGAQIWAVIISLVLTVIFTALPKGNFF